MTRPLRIGLIAEGEAEQGTSVPYLNPAEGGQVIDVEKEGALHTLIRRELNHHGLPDCQFVHRHPSLKERGVKLRTGHSILDRKYLAKIISVWKPEEIDMIVIVADADDVLPQRQQKLARALATIRENHFGDNDEPIPDRSLGGLAIRTFETWLLADTQTVAQVLEVEMDAIANLEEVENAKEILDGAIAHSAYLKEDTSNQRPLTIRWNLAKGIDLSILKSLCPKGFGEFTSALVQVAQTVQAASGAE